MGRHAAPDDEPEVVAEQPTIRFATAVDNSLRPPGSRPLPVPRGRHSQPDEDEDEGVDEVDAVAVFAAVAQADTEPVPVPETVPRAESSAAKNERATAADIRLLRTDSALRARVIAALVVPFVLYTVVLVFVGRVDTWAVWIWLPLITAGVGAGVLLDKAHAREKKRPDES